MTRYIVELEPGVWLAPWSIEPITVADPKRGKRFRSTYWATRDISFAREYKAYPNAKIVEVES